MNQETLRQCLRREVELWSAKSIDALAGELADVVAYTCDEPDSCQVEVQLLESSADRVHVLLSVDDGGWRAFAPLSTSFLVYRDGRVEVPSL